MTEVGPSGRSAPADDVVLVDESGRAVGRAPRAEVHTTTTPLHLAFSCYLLRAGQVLLTRRALTKRTWPGVWTNSFCGHPGPGETLERAVDRYARHELGVSLTSLSCVLPDFRYRAVDPSGTVENELCPVFVGTTDDDVAPNPDEVMELDWGDAHELVTMVARLPRLVSPWMVEQLAAMPDHTLLDPESGRTS